MLKIVADTNILISAILFGGVSDQILNLVREQKVELFTSDVILHEFAGVLSKKFKFPLWRIEQALLEIKDIAIIIFPTHRLSIIKKDESDNRILECAIKGKVQYIISGDKHHLLPLKKYRGVKIISSAEFLSIFSRHI